MSPKAIILSTLSPGRSATKMSMLKTLFRLEKSSCKACPTGFYQTFKRKVITMKEGKQQRGTDPMEQRNSGLIFARVTALMSTRAINLNDVLKYELPAVPTSIFDEISGEFRISKSKSTLKRILQVEVTNTSRGTGDAVVIEGCAILWVLQWPSKGFLKDVVVNFVKYATDKMHCYRRTHVIFDRYNTSIKDATRCQRACEATREYTEIDDERSTAATASCPLSYKEQSPAN